MPSKTNHSTTQKSTVTVKPQTNLLKKYILYVLTGGLIISALIAIISVLVGEFSDIAARSLGATVIIVVHALLGLAFLSIRYKRTLAANIIINSLFAAVIISMLGSILGIWEIFSGAVVLDIYGVIMIGLLASLIVSGLLTAHLDDKVTNILAIGSSLATVAAFAMLLPWIFENNAYILPDFYYRIVGALFILAATSIILTVIFDRVYASKNPQVDAGKTGIPFWAKFAIGFGVFISFGWLAIPLFFWILGVY